MPLLLKSFYNHYIGTFAIIHYTVGTIVSLISSTIGMSGTVHINGRIRDNNKPYQFRRLSAYIQQEDMIRPKLTVRETMTIAAHLKLGFNVTTAYKREQVRLCSTYITSFP